MAASSNPVGAGSPSGPAPWYATPLFHLLTGLIGIIGGIVWLKVGGDPLVASGAFTGGLAFLAIGVGTSAASSSSGL